MEDVECSYSGLSEGDYLVTGKNEDDAVMGCAAFYFEAESIAIDLYYVENYYDDCSVGEDFIRIKRSEDEVLGMLPGLRSG